jgi:Tfp pilus assembly protein PilP
MAKKKKLTLFQKFAYLGLLLTVTQVGLLIYFRATNAPLSAREAIDKALEKVSNVEGRRLDMLKVQLAIGHYRKTNKNLPATLDVLVPIYFDFVPVDSATGKPFSYKIDGKRFILGEDGSKLAGTLKNSYRLGKGALTTQDMLIASLGSGAAQDSFIYDPQGKRDPFTPFSFAQDQGDLSKKAPLERFSVGQLKLSAVLEGFDEPRALVENSAHQGFTIQKGTKIGTNNGVVVEIQKDRVLILEEEVDFTGQKKNRTIEMKLHKADDNKDSKSLSR